MDSLDDHPPGSKPVVKKRTLDTFFPSTWLLVLMVGIVLVFNMIVGMKVFSLEKEKAVIEILKARYESYAQIIEDVEEKEERLRTLIQEIVPLEKRRENALKETAASNERVGKNKEELNKIAALKSEFVERLNAAQATIAELSNEKQTLRKENTQLVKIVAEISVEEERVEKQITEKRQDLRIVEENIAAAEVRLKDQQKYIKEVAAANSSFEDMRKQLSEFVTRMDETQLAAGEKIQDLKQVIAGVAVEKDQLARQAVILVSETKNFGQSNAAILEETKGLQQSNKEYRAEMKNVALVSENMETITEAIKENAENIELDEGQVRGIVKAIKDNLGHLVTASQNLKEVIAGVANEKVQLAIHAVSLAKETEKFVQSNAAIQEETKGLQGHNRGYKSEVEDIILTSRQMKSTIDAIKGFVANLEADEVLIKEYAINIKSNLGQISVASQELEQTSTQFSTAVGGVTSQREKLDNYFQEIGELPDMKAQVMAFEKVLDEIEEVAKKLSDRGAVIQSSFDGKLNGMNLSFGTLEEDFTNLSLKVDGLEQILGILVSKAQEMKTKSLEN